MRVNVVIALTACCCFLNYSVSYAWSESGDQVEYYPAETDTSYNDNYSSYNDNYNNRYNDNFNDNFYDDFSPEPPREVRQRTKDISNYDSASPRLPKQITASGERVIVIDPRVHAWGAYSANGELIRSGLATAGAKWCDDIGRPCRTKTGIFKIFSMGDRDCISNQYPVEEGGGAPMPYCMFFNGGQAIHGSHQVVHANVSHGCVRVSVQDAQWIRFDFAKVGTKIIVKSY